MDTIFTSPQGGPAQPVQEIQNQQVPVQQLPQKKNNFRKVFNITSWIVLFALLPVTVLIFLSQNTVPGDLFYPVKRSLENVVLAAASVSPATRAAFRTDLTTKRFDEAEKLLLASSSNNGLSDFVTEIQAAQNEVSAISDPVKKQELQQKIQTSVTEYEKRLDSVKTQLVAREEAVQLAFGIVTPTIEPTTLPLPTNASVPSPTSKTVQQVIPTNTPVPFPTSTPKPPIRSKSPTATPTPTPISPTNTPTTGQIQAPTITPIPSFTPTPIPTPQPTREEETIGTVDRVQDFLRCLQKTPPPHRECVPPEIKSVNFSSDNKSERRREEKEEREERNEDDRKDKHEKEKKDSSDRENRMLKEDQK